MYSANVATTATKKNAFPFQRMSVAFNFNGAFSNNKKLFCLFSTDILKSK